MSIDTDQRPTVVTGRTRQVLNHVAHARTEGLTVADLRNITGFHHGQASATLSRLHQSGHLARLTERRYRSAVYVTPDHVDGRDTVPYGRTRTTTDNRDDDADTYQIGWADGQADLRRRVLSILNRHSMQQGSRLYVDLKNMLDQQ